MTTAVLWGAMGAHGCAATRHDTEAAYVDSRAVTGSMKRTGCDPHRPRTDSGLRVAPCLHGRVVFRRQVRGPRGTAQVRFRGARRPSCSSWAAEPRTEATGFQKDA